MGYDCYVVEKDKRVQALEAEMDMYEAGEIAREVYMDLLKKKFDLLDETGDYFQANISGMGWLSEIMQKIGMLDAKTDMPRFEWENEAQGEENIKAGSDSPGIPWWKFSSNDGWHVTEEECREALALYHAFIAINGPELPIPQEELDDPDQGMNKFFAEWLVFIHHASTRGGFRVY